MTHDPSRSQSLSPSQLNQSPPDLAEPILGWRSWLIVPDLAGTGPILSSIILPGIAVWPVRTPMVACCPTTSIHTEMAPARQCACGIYSTKHSDRSAWGASTPLGLRRSVVYGQVASWGRVFEHTDGWRAQYAYPASFVIQDKTPAKTIVACTIIAIFCGVPQWRALLPDSLSMLLYFGSGGAVGLLVDKTLEMYCEIRQRTRLRKLADRYGVPLVIQSKRRVG